VILVLAVSAIKEAVEDYKRYRSDREVNNRTVKAVRAGNQRAERILWSEVRVGDILKVKEGEEIPADLFLISSSDGLGRGHIQTANLDGETNLKLRTSLQETRENRTFEQIAELHIEVDCEEPNAELYEYEGTLSVGDEDLPVGSDQLLLRGSRLANTKWVYGLVIYTGRQTKFVLNMTDPPYKNSNVEKVTNRLILGVLALLIVMCLLSAVLGAVWDDTSGEDHGYLDLPSDDSVMLVIVQRFFTFLILYNNMIPISLYVSIEIVRVIQAYFLNEDRLMYDPATESRMIPRTSNLNEELGQVSFIFSDKTGTLTANEMVFRCAHIGGTIYGEVPDLVEEYRRLDELLDGNEVDIGEEDMATSKSQGLLWNQPGHTEFCSEMLETALGVGGNAAQNLRDFFVNMAVNHTVMPVVKNDRLVYQASSPDESALVDGAAAAGVVLRLRENDTLTVDVFDEQGQQFQVLQVNAFTSERKRMSVVARFPDGSLRLLAKGADQTMLPLLGEDTPALDAALTSMETFASNGLRTLVVAERLLTAEEHDAWVQQYYRPASLSTSNRAQLLVEAAAQIETGLRLVGITGVEDKLQRGVPDTIATLLHAGIRIWVLTGDKKETAENIADACNLLAGAERLVLDQSSKAETEAQLAAWEEAWDAEEDYALIVNGHTLSYCMEPDVELDFLEVARRCVSVVIARAAPIQKRQVVELVQREMGEISLAVGDGANDVPMIQAAEIGVGIRGKEGMQAALSSDYSIGQFRFLKRLLLVHGHWNYKRIAFLVCYFFYKNFVISFLPFWFGIDNQ
jgi:phospholipid-transporting ATPase